MSTSAAAEATALPLRPAAGRPVDDDAALVEAARAGSREAVESLFHRHWRRLYRAAYLISRDAAAAEDIAQESFLAALRALDRFDRRRPLGPWLDRIAANRAIDWQRARAVRGEVLVDEPVIGARAGRAVGGGGRMSPDGLATRLRDVRAPGEEEATERAWTRIAAELDAVSLPADPLRDAARPSRRSRFLRRPAALAAPYGRRPRLLRSPADRARRHRLAPLGLALAIVAALAVGAFTPPGDAVADWLRRAVERPKPASKPAPGPLALPAGGAVLVQAPGALWIVDADGDRHRLGRWDAASWSPSGRFVAVVHGQRLAALDRRGRIRWSLTRPFGLAQPAWSPDRFHVAYRSGNGLRVVAGDGTGDRFVAGGLGAAAPAWQPGRAPVVTWADRRGRVRAADADTARALWTGDSGPAVRFLSWSADGTRLAAVSVRAVRFYDARGRLLRRMRLPAGTTADAAAFTRQGALLTLALHDARRGFSQVVTTAAGRHPSRLRPLFGDRGRIGGLVYSPPGGWLLVAWRGADEWVFLRTPVVDRVKAVGGVTRRLEPGASAYPQVLGWCCPP